MNHGLECVLKFLDESVGLQDVNDTNKQKEPLPLVVPGRDAPWRCVMDLVHWVTRGLDALHDCRTREHNGKVVVTHGTQGAVGVWLQE